MVRRRRQQPPLDIPPEDVDMDLACRMIDGTCGKAGGSVGETVDEMAGETAGGTATGVVRKTERVWGLSHHHHRHHRHPPPRR